MKVTGQSTYVLSIEHLHPLKPALYIAFILLPVLGLAAKDQPPGFPDRSADLDALPGFKSPPAGYGQVPFWWWTGDDLDEDRLLWQLRQLSEKGISGVQVNYSHTDEPGWPSDPNCKLSVGGKIIADEVRVQAPSNWPDFVFQPDHDLLSLH